MCCACNAQLPFRATRREGGLKLPIRATSVGETLTFKFKFINIEYKESQNLSAA